MPPKKPETAKPATKAAPSYSEQAAALADDARALAERVRGEVTDLVERVNEVQQTEPTVQEAPAADGVRRVPMAVGDVIRALEGLTAAAAELQQRAAG